MEKVQLAEAKNINQELVKVRERLQRLLDLECSNAYNDQDELLAIGRAIRYLEDSIDFLSEAT